MPFGVINNAFDGFDCAMLFTIIATFSFYFGKKFLASFFCSCLCFFVSYGSLEGDPLSGKFPMHNVPSA
jgi:hypothetical protein